MRKLILLAVTALWGTAIVAQPQPFTFVQMSDPHIGAGTSHDQELRLALEDVDKNFPEAAFIILSGDVTEFGFEEEFDALTEVLQNPSRPIYSCMGNHDVRWSNSGKENYRNALKDTYIKFDYNDVRFVIMDSSMLIEHYGHFDGQQMKQLEADLKSLSDSQFAIVTMHHPPLHAKHFIDNEYKFAELIGDYNVPLVMDGHGHTLERYSYNGTTYAMGASVSTKGGPNGTYRVYRVNENEIEALVRDFKNDKTTLEPPVALTSLNRKSINTTQHAAKAFSVAVNAQPYSGNASVTFDQKSISGLKVENGILDLADIPFNNGIHQLTIEVPDDNTTIISTLSFESAEDDRTTITRRFPLLSGNQSHPLVDGDVLYVGANDNFLRAFDLNDEAVEELWKTDLNSEILSAPAAYENAIIVGSMDSHVYSLDKKTGNINWKFKTGQAVLAGPLVKNDRVYIGSGDGYMYALDAKSGEKLWAYQTPQKKLIKATPALANGRLFFGAWDNHFYALNAETGELIWAAPVGPVTNGHFSAATSNPVISGKNVIFCSHDYTVRCLSQESGGTIWTYKPTADELGPSYSTAVIHDGVAYFGSISGFVVGHDVETGKKVFNVNVRPEKKDDLFDSLPVLKDGKIYIGSVGGNLYRVDIVSQSVDWSVALQPGFIFTRPALWKNRVLIGTLNDMVYEIEYKN